MNDAARHDTAVSELFDPGLQPERTALAWRRAGLSMCVGALAALRIFPDLLGAWTFVPAAVALAFGLTVLVSGQLRYRRDHRTLVDSGAATFPALSGGVLVTITAAAVFGLGLCAAAVWLLRQIG